MLVFVIGTRAQLVKMAPVVRAAQARALPMRILLTGQHFESMQALAEDLSIGAVFPTDTLISERATVTSLLGWLPSAFLRCRRQLVDIRAFASQSIVLVHGDTASTLLAAVAARSAGLRVAHVESGLTSGALFDPFPEEIVRQMVSRLAQIGFCPDEASFERMRARRNTIVLNTHGNTIIDALRLATDGRHSDHANGGAVVSLHRFENIMRRTRLQTLVDDIRRLADKVPVSFVLHPPTEKRLRTMGLLDVLSKDSSVQLLPRMPYSRFMALVAKAAVVVTDGGSNQEELSLLGVPAIIMRARTERNDGLGESCILEPDLPCDWVDYILSGQIMAMRRPNMLELVESPSQRIVDCLEGML
jgi:UDP-N-acetylglucosamine 2-epimerase (non-hydrolysing)